MIDAADRVDARPLVLIVDDDQSMRLMWRECFSLAGFRTADAHNGFQALDKARELLPDAVLTDLAVPGIDGFELSRILQDMPATRRIPVLAITGHPEYLEQPERFRNAGIARVLTKPCPPDVIVEEMRRLLAAASGPLGESDPQTGATLPG